MDFDPVAIGFDKMLEFGVEAIDEEKEVVNPIHRKLTQKLRKEVEKRKRLQLSSTHLLNKVLIPYWKTYPQLHKSKPRCSKKKSCTNKKNRS